MIARPRALLLVLLLATAFVAAALLATRGDPGQSGPAPPTSAGVTPAAAAAGEALLLEAFREKRSDFLVTGAGEVTRLLADDREGSRHQRFILTLARGHTLLISHNIDLAERVPLAVGDRVEFHGEYEWNHKGGVIHWTHHDPRGRRPGGWLRHDGRTYR